MFHEKKVVSKERVFLNDHLYREINETIEKGTK